MSSRSPTQDVSLAVKTDGSLSLEENMRQNLLACYTELVDILKQMAVTHVSGHHIIIRTCTCIGQYSGTYA